MYLLLKASRVNVTNHPVIKRLYQYRKLLFQMDKSFEENLKQQIEEIFKGNVTYSIINLIITLKAIFFSCSTKN